MKNVKKNKNNVTEKLSEPGETNDFSRILQEAISEALSTFGEDVKVSIFFHLENKCGIKKRDIPQRISDFSDALQRIFGIGASNLEIMFMESLHSKLNFVCKWPTGCKWEVAQVTFQEYVQLMKQKFEEEMVGKSFLQLEFFDRENKAILAKNFEKRMNGVDVEPYDVKFTAKNGQGRYVEVRGKAIEYFGKQVNLV